MKYLYVSTRRLRFSVVFRTNFRMRKWFWEIWTLYRISIFLKKSFSHPKIGSNCEYNYKNGRLRVIIAPKNVCFGFNITERALEQCFEWKIYILSTPLFAWYCEEKLRIFDISNYSANITYKLKRNKCSVLANLFFFCN